MRVGQGHPSTVVTSQEQLLGLLVPVSPAPQSSRWSPLSHREPESKRQGGICERLCLALPLAVRGLLASRLTILGLAPPLFRALEGAGVTGVRTRLQLKRETRLDIA